jgi:hypothetical protein
VLTYIAALLLMAAAAVAIGFGLTHLWVSIGQAWLRTQRAD